MLLPPALKCGRKIESGNVGLKSNAIGGAHQQTSERAAPPVSVEEKGKSTGDKKENCYYFCLWAYKIKINFIYVVRRAPEHY
jgi:hypothetical protein